MKNNNLRSLTTSIIGTAMFLIFLGCSASEDSPSTSETSLNPDSSSDQHFAAESFVNFSSDAVDGANVYVPVYSHIYQMNQQKTFNLTTTLSIRNTDLQEPVILKKVYYYDSQGGLVHRYLDEPRKVPALSSISFVVEEEDLRGGVGANFLVLWEAMRPVNEPVIEAVMISTSQQQGISFVSEGRVINSVDRSGP
ncbi:DUF3124 domain-containing protein [Halalkalibaculum sp. DA3122]|uniref:DUF3124 domain-containing protein n=1 Tax=unclassified Halalkalibaculum TaxID=2964617 RepID=UPI0037552447